MKDQEQTQPEMADKREMTYEEQMHHFRKQIDANIQAADGIIATPLDIPAHINSECRRRMQIVHNKLSEAKMWVGKCLEAYGSKLPKEFQDKAE